ncbi:hypothetical protein AB0B10_26090 [Micromonospora arborensis]|uniref:hypothetical protein n=1 Tax=Micromonospora arborensis TaxID=2116518 RepID=UPI0033FE66F1
MKRANRISVVGGPRIVKPRFGEDMSEDELKVNVLDACKLLRLRVAHFRPARTEKGWRTPVEGDGAGFLDLVIVGVDVLYRELKSREGRIEPDQQLWIDDLKAAGANVDVWRPVDWMSGRIQRELTVIRRRR